MGTPIALCFMMAISTAILALLTTSSSVIGAGAIIFLSPFFHIVHKSNNKTFDCSHYIIYCYFFLAKTQKPPTGIALATHSPRAFSLDVEM